MTVTMVFLCSKTSGLVLHHALFMHDRLRLLNTGDVGSGHPHVYERVCVIGNCKSPSHSRQL